jgi:hypothetical protein
MEEEKRPVTPTHDEDDLLVEIDPVESAKIQPRAVENQHIPTRGE